MAGRASKFVKGEMYQTLPGYLLLVYEGIELENLLKLTECCFEPPSILWPPTFEKVVINLFYARYCNRIKRSTNNTLRRTNPKTIEKAILRRIKSFCKTAPLISAEQLSSLRVATTLSGYTKYFVVVDSATVADDTLLTMFCKILLPDGGIGWLPESSLKEVTDWSVTVRAEVKPWKISA